MKKIIMLQWSPVFCKMQVHYNVFLGVSCYLLLNGTWCFYCPGLLLLFGFKWKCLFLRIVTAKVVKIRTLEYMFLMQPLDVCFPLLLYSELRG